MSWVKTVFQTNVHDIHYKFFALPLPSSFVSSKITTPSQPLVEDAEQEAHNKQTRPTVKHAKKHITHGADKVSSR